MITKKFYTVAELANIMSILTKNVESAGELRDKMQRTELKDITEELFTKSMKTLGDFERLLNRLDNKNMVIDYIMGIDKTTGNKKVEVMSR